MDPLALARAGFTAATRRRPPDSFFQPAARDSAIMLRLLALLTAAAAFAPLRTSHTRTVFFNSADGQGKIAGSDSRGFYAARDARGRANACRESFLGQRDARSKRAVHPVRRENRRDRLFSSVRRRVAPRSFFVSGRGGAAAH